MDTVQNWSDNVPLEDQIDPLGDPCPDLGSHDLDPYIGDAPADR